METAAELLILVAALWMLLGSVGLLRFPDVYNRLHAAGIGGTVGILLLGLGVTWLASLQHGVVMLRPLLAVVLIFLISPVSSHMIAQAAYRSGVALAAGSTRDDLAGTNLAAEGDGAGAPGSAERPAPQV